MLFVYEVLYSKIIILCLTVRFAFQNECPLLYALADLYKKKRQFCEGFRRKYSENSNRFLLRKKIYLTF